MCYAKAAWHWLCFSGPGAVCAAAAAATRAGSPSLLSSEIQFTPQLVPCHSSLTLAVFQGLGLSLCSSSNESKQPSLVTQFNNTVCSTCAMPCHSSLTLLLCVSGPGAVQQQQEPAASPPPQVPAPGYAAACQAPSPGLREVHLRPQLLVRQHGECQGVWGMSAGQSLPLLVSTLQLQALFK